jgi:hypothetical protein
VNLLAVPQNAKLFEHLNMFQRAWRPGHIAANKASTVTVDPQMAQEGITNSLF